MTDPWHAEDFGARACASNPTPEDRWLQKLHRKAERQRREEMDRQRREHLRAERERIRAEEEERLRQFELEVERQKEYNRLRKSEKKMLAQQRRGKGVFSIRPVIRKAEVADVIVQFGENPENKNYQYTCANGICGLTRMVKGTKPRAGWDCFDGGYVCRRRYKCKRCPRSFYKESDSDNEYECKDVGEKCMPAYKCKSCLRRFFTYRDIPKEQGFLCEQCAFQRWCRNEAKKNWEN